MESITKQSVQRPENLFHFQDYRQSIAWAINHNPKQPKFQSVWEYFDGRNGYEALDQPERLQPIYCKIQTVLSNPVLILFGNGRWWNFVIRICQTSKQYVIDVSPSQRVYISYHTLLSSNQQWMPWYIRMAKGCKYYLQTNDWLHRVHSLKERMPFWYLIGELVN